MGLTRPTTGVHFERFLAELTGGRPARAEEALAGSRHLVARLGNPQDHARQVHVVGTAGKGTTAAAVTAAVRPETTVATHMSPHVYDLRERFLLNGDLPEWSTVIEAAVEVHAAAEAVAAASGRPPTFFAATATTAWVMGRRAGVDLQVTEAGIGGRVDATNVIGRDDKISVVTAIGLDHSDVLGDEIGAVAREKAAVVAEGGVVIIGPQPHAIALDSVTELAAERNARMVVVDQSIADWREAADAIAHAVALELGRPASAGPDGSRPPGRGEPMLVDGRPVTIDGAHNPLKISTALSTVARPEGGLTAVVAIGAGKDLHGCAVAMAGVVDRVVVTEFGDPVDVATHPRSWPVSATVQAVRAAGIELVGVGADPAEAVDIALAATGADGGIVVTGSFFHLAAARARLLERGATVGGG